METHFEPAENGTKVYFDCPRCHKRTQVTDFDIEPVLTGNGDFVEKWFLKVYGVCHSCECCGTRAVGVFTAEGSRRMAK